MSGAMAYMKFYLTQTPDQQFVLARCFSGVSFEDNQYSGTLVLPSPTWEHFLDSLVFGASHIIHEKERLEVYFAPESGIG